MTVVGTNVAKLTQICAYCPWDKNNMDNQDMQMITFSTLFHVRILDMYV